MKRKNRERVTETRNLDKTTITLMKQEHIFCVRSTVMKKIYIDMKKKFER